MTEPDELVRLRELVEEHRARELESLRAQLAEAKADAVHYRAEAERNAQVGHAIAREADAERATLRERISVLEQFSGTRSPRPAA